MTIEIVACRDADAVADRLAELVVNAVTAKADLVLGLPTGRTMIGVYRRLVEAYRQGRVSFQPATCVNVDEYVGLSADDPQSFTDYMREHFFRHVDVEPHRRYIPDGTAADLGREARHYEELIQSLGGFDLLLLGLGVNGHIAFNEPGSSVDSRTRVVRLTQPTLEANRCFFTCSEEQPRSALTIGIGTILAARKILVVATGAAKASAVKAMLTGAPITNCPASALAMHRDVRLFLDAVAEHKWLETVSS